MKRNGTTNNKESILEILRDARYLQFFIQTLQSQFDKSVTFDVSNGQHTAEARVELNIPGLSIEYEEDTYPVLWT